MQFFVPTMTIESLEVDPFARRAAIKLRPTGIVATILNLVGLSRTVTYEADSEGYRVHSTSISATTKNFIPWDNASGSWFSCSKPVEYLFTGIGLASGSVSFLLSGVWLNGGVMLAAGAALVVYFLMSSKKTSVGIQADSGASETFKVNTTTEQFEQLEAYYDLLCTLILAAETTATHHATPPAFTVPSPEDKAPTGNRPVVTPAPMGFNDEPRVNHEVHRVGFTVPADDDEYEPRVTTCPNCQVQMKIKKEFLGRRAACRACQRPFVVT